MKPGTFALRAYVGRSPTGSPRYLHETYVHPRSDGGIKEARRRLKALELRARDHRIVSSTLGALLDDWLAHAKKIGRSPNTLKGYRNRVPVIKAGLGGILLSVLTAKHIDQWYGSLIEAGKSPADVMAYHRVLHAALEQGLDWDVDGLDRNVADRARPPFVPDPDIEPPSPEEVEILIRMASESRSPEMSALIFFAAITGMRRGELCGLHWHRIDWAGQRVHVARAVWQDGRDIGEKDTKSHQTRWISIGALGVGLLKGRLVRAQEAADLVGVRLDPEGYVWSSDEAGHEPWKPDRMTQAFDRLCRKAEKPARDAALAAGRQLTEEESWPYRLHDLRHYSATELLHAGVDLATVSERLGHAQKSTTSNIYGHGREASDKRSADILGRRLQPKPKKALEPAKKPRRKAS